MPTPDDPTEIRTEGQTLIDNLIAEARERGVYINPSKDGKNLLQAVYDVCPEDKRNKVFDSLFAKIGTKTESQTPAMVVDIEKVLDRRSGRKYLPHDNAGPGVPIFEVVKDDLKVAVDRYIEKIERPTFLQSVTKLFQRSAAATDQAADAVPAPAEQKVGFWTGLVDKVRIRMQSVISKIQNYFSEEHEEKKAIEANRGGARNIFSATETVVGLDVSKKVAKGAVATGAKISPNSSPNVSGSGRGGPART